MEERSVKIVAPEGYEIDKESSTFEKIVFKKVENKYPKDWEEAFFGKNIQGFWIERNGEINDANYDADLEDIVIFKTKKQAKSALAYAQLTQLMALPCYNGDWEADWTNGDTIKYVIRGFDNDIELVERCNTSSPIAFKSREVRDAFYNNHMDLLETYFEL